MQKRRLSVDGFVRRPVQVIRRPAMRSHQVDQPSPRRRYAKPEPVIPKKRMPEWLQTILVITMAIIFGMFAGSEVFGQLTIVAYGLVAFIWGIASRVTFTLALVSMVAMIVLMVGRGNVPLAQNFATYTFLLLVAGVITLGRELKKEGGRIYSIRERDTNNH